MFSFVILCQLLGPFILHISQFVSYLFFWCQQQAKFGGPSDWHPQRIQKQKQMYNDHILFKLLQRLRLTSLNFLSQLSFWSKDVKICTNLSSISGDHLMECKLLFVWFGWHFKNKQNVNCVAAPQESQALLYILIISNPSWIQRMNLISWCWSLQVMVTKFCSQSDDFIFLLSTICQLNTYMIKEQQISNF
jgi:hypothetical protein